MKMENIKKQIIELNNKFKEYRDNKKVIEDGLLLILRLNESWLDEACQKLCGVLYQTHAGFSEDDTGIYRTQYNYDAEAVWFLNKQEYIEVTDGEWPQTKYLNFKFTDKFKG